AMVAAMAPAPRMPQRIGRSGSSGALIASPASSVDDLLDGLAAPPQRRRTLVRQAMPDGHRADRQVVLGYAECLPEARDLGRRNPEEAGAQALVNNRLQHEKGRHAGVDVPVRHRPARLVHIGPSLVGLRITLEVDPLAR